MSDDDYPYIEQGQRLKWVRLAEGIPTAHSFARMLGWPQSAMSQFETGVRMMPAEKALELRRKIPGFDPIWLWEGDERGLSFDLRQRISRVRRVEKVEDALGVPAGYAHDGRRRGNRQSKTG